MTHETNFLMCPSCKTYMCKAKNTDGHTVSPTEGDFAICANCAEVLRFVLIDGNLNYRKATQADIDEVINCGVYERILAARDFILQGNHGLCNMTKEELDSINRKENW